EEIELPTIQRADSILTEIRETGVLLVGLRKDAAPFGFINREQAWDGYCGNLALALGDYLSAELDLNIPIEVVELTSTVSDRYDLVRDNVVHFECGPNTIRQDVAGVNFSSPFFISSAQCLTPAGQEEQVNPNLPLTGVRLGVLSDTTTEQFVQSTYPTAERVLFSGPEGLDNAIEAVEQGDIDAYVGDGILSYAAVLLEGKAVDEFILLPELPLTCEFYGLALPNDDDEWQTMVNQFLRGDRADEVFDSWFTDLYPAALEQAEFCLNR
ncbi:MAG: transporter substrate-binding domain-containing protein, partial [Cyanobacteria bacterium J06553_1]